MSCSAWSVWPSGVGRAIFRSLYLSSEFFRTVVGHLTPPPKAALQRDIVEVLFVGLYPYLVGLTLTTLFFWTPWASSVISKTTMHSPPMTSSGPQPIFGSISPMMASAHR